MANVLNFGADPTGVGNSTAAVLAAIAATPVSGVVCFPMTAAGGTYKINCDTIDAAGRTFQGDFANVTTHSTLVAAAAGNTLLIGTSECSIRALDLDGANLAQFSLRLVNASDSEVRGVLARRALAWGVEISGGTSLLLDSLNASASANGMRVIGADNSEFYACVANNNAGVGLRVQGGVAAQLGSIKWFGGQWDVNVVGPQLELEDVEAALFTGVYVEGASPCLRLFGASGCANNVFEELRFVIGEFPLAFPIRIDHGNKNTFVGCSSPGIDSRRIFLNATGGAPGALLNQFYGCFRASNIATDYMRLYYDNGAGTVWEATQRQNGLTSAAGNSPTVSAWQVGDIVWNNVAGAPAGWRCTVAGEPGTWTAF